MPADPRASTASRPTRTSRAISLGGTAVGTGLNTHPEFAERVCAGLSKRTGRTFSTQPIRSRRRPPRRAGRSVRRNQGHRGLSDKIANDLRLSIGPSAGLAEIELPELQKGSSIMPGKVNPVISESSCRSPRR